MNVIYIVGIPGSGKTSMVDGALRRLHASAEFIDHPIPHTRYDGWLWHLGSPRANFGGTDTLSMSIQPRVIEWLPQAEADGCDLLLGEGDRLANNKFFRRCPKLTLVYLDTPLSLARHRAAYRAVELGSGQQAESWWKGRVTKVDGLVGGNPHIRLDGRQSSDALAAELVTMLVAGRDRSSAAK
jgi:hypothetical protein